MLAILTIVPILRNVFKVQFILSKSSGQFFEIIKRMLFW